MLYGHEHEIEILEVVPGPQSILLVGVVDGDELTIDLEAPALLANLGMELAEFTPIVWGGGPDPEQDELLAEDLRSILAYHYHLNLGERKHGNPPANNPL